MIFQKFQSVFRVKQVIGLLSTKYLKIKIRLQKYGISVQIPTSVSEIIQ